MALPQFKNGIPVRNISKLGLYATVILTINFDDFAIPIHLTLTQY